MILFKITLWLFATIGFLSSILFVRYLWSTLSGKSYCTRCTPKTSPSTSRTDCWRLSTRVKSAEEIKVQRLKQENALIRAEYCERNRLEHKKRFGMSLPHIYGTLIESEIFAREKVIGEFIFDDLITVRHEETISILRLELEKITKLKN